MPKPLLLSPVILMFASTAVRAGGGHAETRPSSEMGLFDGAAPPR